jgi:hypothetical protein
MKLRSKSNPSVSRRIHGSRSKSSGDKALEDLRGAKAIFVKSRRSKRYGPTGSSKDT